MCPQCPVCGIVRGRSMAVWGVCVHVYTRIRIPVGQVRETTTTTTTTVRRDDALLYTRILSKGTNGCCTTPFTSSILAWCPGGRGAVRYIILFSFSFEFFAAHKYRLVSLNTDLFSRVVTRFGRIYSWSWGQIRKEKEEGRRKRNMRQFFQIGFWD